MRLLGYVQHTRTSWADVVEVSLLEDPIKQRGAQLTFATDTLFLSTPQSHSTLLSNQHVFPAAHAVLLSHLGRQLGTCILYSIAIAHSYMAPDTLGIRKHNCHTDTLILRRGSLRCRRGRSDWARYQSQIRKRARATARSGKFRYRYRGVNQLVWKYPCELMWDRSTAYHTV
jgi:hypothetical protein